jgi:sulfite dehydrogenase (cytochrome) subunit B
MRTLGIFTAAALLVLALAARADESGIKLKDGAGRDLVLGYCSGCHSLDYVQGNSPFMNRATWEAEVNKMMKAYGAQIPAQDVPKVVDYLVAQYGVAPATGK